MTLLRTMLAVMFVIISVLLAAGCVGQSNDIQTADNGSAKTTAAPTPNQTPTVDSSVIGKQKLAAIAPIQDYKQNMEGWQKKLPTDLLYILDPDFPKMGNTRDEVKVWMNERGWLIFADEAVKKFNLKPPAGDHVFVSVAIISSASPDVIDPFVAWREEYGYNSTNGDHHISAWVDLNDIEKLASIEGVSIIDWIDLPYRSPFRYNLKTEIRDFRETLDEYSALGVDIRAAEAKYEEAYQYYNLSQSRTPGQEDQKKTDEDQATTAIYDGKILLDRLWAEKKINDTCSEIQKIDVRFNSLMKRGISLGNPQLHLVFEKREAAAINISKARDFFQTANYAQARMYADRGSWWANESINVLNKSFPLAGTKPAPGTTSTPISTLTTCSAILISGIALLYARKRIFR